MSPCNCGDPYCQCCFPGNDGGALEEAESALLEKLAKLRLSLEEYELLGEIASSIILSARRYAQAIVAEQRATDALVKDLEERDRLAKDWKTAQPIEFSESHKGYEARDKWAQEYDKLNGAPENHEDA